MRKYPILCQRELTASIGARSAPDTSMESGAAIVQRRMHRAVKLAVLDRMVPPLFEGHP